ncbi:MAG: hypothetical protein EOO15_01665 [Chitinophagaceae bacterium]|nr:MAG: hypothetical protein EOO15_01665 [Chitinophagaceae bacterium]
MKKTILALAALLGTGAMGWAQNTTTNGTSGSTTTNGSSSTNSTMSPGSNTSTNTNTNTSTGTDLNGTGTNTGVNGNAPTTDGMTGSSTSAGTGSTSSMVNPGNSNTTGTLQSSTTAGVDYNTMQNTPNGNTQVTMQSNSNYAAYGSATAVPGNLSMSLQRDYPSAFSPSWQQSGDWYRASFNNMNRNMMVYYAPNGNSYSVALPVLNGFVPEEVVTKALSAYGSNLYSISRVKAANGSDAFQVNLLDGGIARSEFIGEDGSSFAAIDVFRHDEDMADGSLMNSSSNAAIGDSSTMSSDINSTSTNSTNTTTNTTDALSTDVNTTTTTTTTDATSTDVNSTQGTGSNTTNSSSADDQKFKHKIKTEDGRKLKIKTKNGETKVKGDALDATGGQ